MALEANSLPNDLPILHEMIRSLVAEVEKRDSELEKLRNQVQWLLRRTYGPRSERYDPNQLTLVDVNSVEPEPAPEQEMQEEEKPPVPRKRRSRKAARRELPRRRVEYDLPAVDKVCGCCNTEKTKIGEDISEEIEYVPASVTVIEHVRPKYACRRCEDGVATAPMPPRVIEKGVPGPGMLAHVAVSKYADHLPLNRQESILERQGLRIAR